MVIDFLHKNEEFTVSRIFTKSKGGSKAKSSKSESSRVLFTLNHIISLII